MGSEKGGKDPETDLKNGSQSIVHSTLSKIRETDRKTSGFSFME